MMMYMRIAVTIVQEIGDLGALSLKGCKAFLRKHGLRLSGTKMVCIQRINEHWELKMEMVKQSIHNHLL